jgi:hypothetical protein
MCRKGSQWDWEKQRESRGQRDIATEILPGLLQEKRLKIEGFYGRFINIQAQNQKAYSAQSTVGGRHLFGYINWQYKIKENVG